MKRIDELGISPWPWKIGGRISNSWIDCRDGHMICDDLDYRVDEAEGLANANLIAAAPELYECLREAVEFIESHADALGDNEDGDVARMVWAFNNTLAEAAGEEVSHG